MLVTFKNDFCVKLPGGRGLHVFSHLDGKQEVPDELLDILPSSAVVDGEPVKTRKDKQREAAAAARAARVAKAQKEASSSDKEKVEEKEKVADPSVPVQTEGQS